MNGWRLRVVPATLALATVAAPAAVAAPAFCPVREGRIDPNTAVDKEALAEVLLDESHVSRLFQRRASGYRGPPGLSPVQTLIAANTDICATLTCSDDERRALIHAGQAFDAALDDSRQFIVQTVDRRAAFFFADAGSTIRCKPEETPVAIPGVASGPGQVPAQGERAGPAAGNQPSLATMLDTIRVRGTPADLVYSRRHSPSFDNASKAELSFSDDNEAGKSTATLVGAVGYPIEFHSFSGASYNSGQIIPYFAMNFDVSRKDGDPRSVSSDTYEFGSVIEFVRSVPFTQGAHVRHFELSFSIIPRVLFNRDDNSRLAALDVLFRPYYSFLNSPRPIDRNDRYRFNLLFDLRLKNGTFLRRGDRAPENSHDFSRIGSRFGLGLMTHGPGIPIELTVTDTYMLALSGRPRHLNLFQSDLSIYLDQHKYFGIDFGYSRGRAEDLSEREDKWTLAFAVRY